MHDDVAQIFNVDLLVDLREREGNSRPFQLFSIRVTEPESCALFSFLHFC